MSEKVKITRAAELESLAVFRDFIQTTCQRLGIDKEIAFSFALSIDEACANVIEHGYAGKDPGSIILEMDIDPARIVVTLTDFGQPFEPSEAPTPDINAPIEERTAGGFGLYFIYSMMDQVDYKTDVEGNRLTLTKYLKK